jgi:hypothetical protein
VDWAGLSVSHGLIWFSQGLDGPVGCGDGLGLRCPVGVPVRALKEMQGEGSPGRGSDAIRRVVLRCKMMDEQEGWGTWGGT